MIGTKQPIQMKKLLLILTGLTFSWALLAQDQGRKAAVVEPSANEHAITLQHPWTGKKVLFIGDSISDSRDTNPGKHYYDHLSEWLGLTAYVPAISGLEMSHVAMQVEIFRNTAPGLQPDMICIFLGTNDYNNGVPIGEWYQETAGEVEAAVGEPKKFFHRMHRTFLYDPETFKGRINMAVKFLREAFPGTPITFFTPIHRAYFDCGNDNVQPEETWPNSIGLYLDSYVQAVQEAANVWSVNVIDLHSVAGLFPLLPGEAEVFFGDNPKDRLHPRYAGHKRLAEVIMYQSLLLPCREN